MVNAQIVTVKKFGRHAWRLAWWLLAIQVVATVAGASMLKIIPKKYESSTTIRVERSQMLTRLVGGLAVSTESEERIRSLREEILTREFFEKLITRLDLEPANATPLQRESRVQEMMKNTRIINRQRDTFQISYTGSDPKEVRDVTNVLAGSFIEERLSDKSGEAGSSVRFLEDQLGVYRKKLEDAETALRHFEERNVDFLPSNRAAYLARVEQLRSNLVEIQNNLRQAKIQRDLLRERTTLSSTASEGNAGLESVMVANPLAAQLREKEAQLRRLLANYSESYPDVILLRGEIAGLQKEIEKSPTVPAAQAMAQRQPSVQDALHLGQLQQVELQIGALTTREQQLLQDYARYEKKVQTIPEVEQQLTALRRDYDVNNDIYNSFLRRLEEAKVSRELEHSKKGEVFRILQAATLPLQPIRPTRLQTVLLGIAAGLGLNALLVLLLAQHDTSIQSAEEAKKLLELKVLAGIPRHLSKKEVSMRLYKSIALTISCAIYAGSVGALLYWNQIVSLIRKGQ